jgi:glycine/D-amino acid oxidase-like deaminating enzyme
MRSSITEPPWRRVDVPPAAPLTGRVTADVAIVGAGLTGLATAYYLISRDPSLDVVLLDAGRPGAGASGRGTGLLGPRIGPAIDKARRRYGDETARACYEASVGWVRQVVRLAGDLGADCGLTTGGQLMVANSPRAAEALARQADAYRELGLDPAPLPDPGRFRAALRFPVAATLDPAALVAALAAEVAGRGVRRFDHSPVRSLGAGELVLPYGTVRARRTVVAVNGFVRSLALPVGTVAPLEVHAVATAPLPAALRAELGPEPVIDVTPLAPYYRLTPQGGLVMGGGPVNGRAERAWAWLAERLPGGTEVTHRWSGRIGMTGDDLPVVGEAVPGVWFAGGCCGHGLALSVASGAYLADALLGEAPPPLPWHRARAPWLPTAGPARPVLEAYLRLLTRRAARDGAALRFST